MSMAAKAQPAKITNHTHVLRARYRQSQQLNKQFAVRDDGKHDRVQAKIDELRIHAREFYYRRDFARQYSPAEVEQLVKAKVLSWARVRVLLGVRDKRLRARLQQQAITGSWTTRALQRQVRLERSRADASDNRKRKGIKAGRCWGTSPNPHGRKVARPLLPSARLQRVIDASDQWLRVRQQILPTPGADEPGCWRTDKLPTANEERQLLGALVARAKAKMEEVHASAASALEMLRSIRKALAKQSDKAVRRRKR